MRYELKEDVSLRKISTLQTDHSGSKYYYGVYDNYLMIFVNKRRLISYHSKVENLILLHKTRAQLMLLCNSLNDNHNAYLEEIYDYCKL